jgi:hypothetical protein
MLKFIFHEFAAERVAVDPEYIRGARAIAVNAIQNAFDEAFLKLSNRLVKEDAMFHHLTHKPFQLILQFGTLQKFKRYGLPGLLSNLICLI